MGSGDTVRLQQSNTAGPSGECSGHQQLPLAAQARWLLLRCVSAHPLLLTAVSPLCLRSCSVVDGKPKQVRLPTGTNRASLGYMSR